MYAAICVAICDNSGSGKTNKTEETMNIANANTALDFKTMTAIVAANPDGVAILGAYNGMETLAREDPEGCVRLSPDLPMDKAALACLFRCTIAVVEKTVEVFEKLGRLSVKDGLIRITGCGEGSNGNAAMTAANETAVAVKPKANANCGGMKTGADSKAAAPKPALTEDALAKKREQARLRKARSRARQKQAQEQQKECNVTPVTNRDGRDKCDTERDKRDSNNIYIRDIEDKEDKKDDKDIFSFSEDETKKLDVLLSYDRRTLIPLAKLPSPFRDIAEAWNGLPLKRLEGLYPAMLSKLQGLLHKYSPEQLKEAIRKIGESPFLLGQSENSTGFVISFKWFLSIPHLEKILSGSYKSYTRNRFFRNEGQAAQRYPDTMGAAWQETPGAMNEALTGTPEGMRDTKEGTVSPAAGNDLSFEDMAPAERCAALSRFRYSRITGAA